MYGKYKNPTYSLRIPEELKQKIEIIAKRNETKASKLYLNIIQDYVDIYEQKFGEIKIEE